MALPRIDTPTYQTQLPSTGETIQFRPFLVKEQKVLLIAYESQDTNQILNAIIDCLSNCIENLSFNKLSTFDVDYIFTQIRSKSVGEKTDILSECTSCNHQEKKSINLGDLKIDGKILKNVQIDLTDDIKVKMKYPSYSDLLRDPRIMSEKTTNTERMFLTIASSIDSVMTADENISLKDETPEEVEQFVNSLSSIQFQEISNFVEGIPKIKYEEEYMCEKCNTKNKIELEGLQDFFS